MRIDLGNESAELERVQHLGGALYEARYTFRGAPRVLYAGTRNPAALRRIIARDELDGYSETFYGPTRAMPK